MKLTGSKRANKSLSDPNCTCKHSRVISNFAVDEPHEAGMVRCVECGDAIPDPHL